MMLDLSPRLRVPQPSDLATRAIHDEPGFEALRDPWHALLESSSRWNPFLTWEWMWSWWLHLRQDATLHLVTAWSGSTLAAAAPLLKRRRGLSWPHRLEFIAAGSGADYLDVIARPEHLSIAPAALAGALAAQPLALHLDNLPPHSLASQVQGHLGTMGWTSLESSPDVCPYIDLDGHSWDSYLATLGPAHRANVRRRTRALHAAFDVRLALVTTDEDRAHALDALFAFHEQRWRDRGGSTAFGTSALRLFHHDVTRRALQCGWLRIYALRLDDRIAGVMYGFARHGRFYFFQHGCDTALATWSPGLVLMALTIRASIEAGLREFDLLYGHEAYKSLWARAHRPLGRLMLFPPHLAGRWQQRRAETRRALRAMAHRIGVKGSQ